MKFIYKALLVLTLIGILYVTKEDIIKWLATHVIKNEEIFILSSKNDYTKENHVNYIKQVNQIIPMNMNDLKNIYYSILNSGEKSYSFYCPREYTSCIDDVKTLANDQIVLSNLNNFVHPFNSFKNIETEYDSFNKVTITYYPVYQESDKATLTNKVLEIANGIDEESPLLDKIKFFHDYIIKHTKYDSNRSDSSLVTYQSDTAYGALIEGYALCGGYTDSMALFLDHLGVENYKIASENHVWNALYIDNTWYHLDLTWDDPITTDGTDIIEYNFYLITTDELMELDSTQHRFNEEVYQELKQ